MYVIFLNVLKGCDFIIDEINEKIDIYYIWVLTYGQKDDLERQKQCMI